MRKPVLLGIFLSGWIFASADYNFMEFKYVDDTAQIVFAEGLVINIEGENLMITNTAGATLSAKASDLVSMQFTDTDPAGVKKILEGETAVKVYNINGVYMGECSSLKEAKETLPNGVYVVKNSNGETIKMVIGK